MTLIAIVYTSQTTSQITLSISARSRLDVFLQFGCFRVGMSIIINRILVRFSVAEM